MKLLATLCAFFLAASGSALAAMIYRPAQSQFPVAGPVTYIMFCASFAGLVWGVLGVVERRGGDCCLTVSVGVNCVPTGV